MIGSQRRGPDWGKLGTFITRGFDGLAEDRAMAQRQELIRSVNQGLFGGGRPVEPTLDLEALAEGREPADPYAAAPQRQGLPSLREAGPMLIRAQQAGLDIGPYVNILDKAGPDIAVENGVTYDRRGVGSGQRIGVNLTNVNGTLVDTQDAANANRFVPNVGEGQEILYDAQGRPQIRNIPGYVRGRTELEGGLAAARSASTSPYELATVTGPDGRPITASRRDILGGGPIQGQSPAEAIRAEGAARRDVELTGGRTQALGRLEAANTSARNLVDAIGQAKSQIGALSTGLIGAATSAIPGTPSRDLRATIETIKANIGFDYLQQMRELSPTGGALGQVAVQELQALQSVLGNLDATQSPEQLERNLDIIERTVTQGLRLRRETFEQQYGGGQLQGQQQRGGDRAAAARAELQRRGRL